MIYVSSACIKSKTIRESVCSLAEAGFKNIELSGGTKYYPEYERDLLQLQDKYALNYQVHNYFPPPEKSFVLNLASLNDQIYRQSINLALNAIKLSKKLGSERYGIHAGFLIDIKSEEVGKNISYNLPSNRAKAIKRFCDAWEIISIEAGNNVDLYIENNVLSHSNVKTYSGKNPFFLTNYKGYLELKACIDFNLLLDIAHLNVSANSLGFNFNKDLNRLLLLSDYIHISENDGLHDQNKPITKKSKLLDKIHGYSLKEKCIVIEVYDDISKIFTSYGAIKNLLEFEKNENLIGGK